MSSLILQPKRWVVRSDKDTHFTGALATDALELETLGDTAGTSQNRVPSFPAIIQRLTVISDQNLAWDVMLFKSTFTPPLSTDCDLHPLVEWLEFKATDAKRVGGAGLYMYTWTSFEIVYTNTDAPGQIHVGLINRDAVAKNAGATGEVIVELQGVTM